MNILTAQHLCVFTSPPCFYFRQNYFANVAAKGLCYTSSALCHAGGYQVDKITTLANRRAIIFHSITDNRRADCVSYYRDLARFETSCTVEIIIILKNNSARNGLRAGMKVEGFFSQW